jgi:hypothetical protein
MMALPWQGWGGKVALPFDRVGNKALQIAQLPAANLPQR